MKFPLRVLTCVAVAAAALTSCANPDSSDGAKSTASASAKAGADGVGLDTSTEGSSDNGFSSGEVGPKVDANAASVEDLKKALTEMKVEDVDKWAPIVEKNRPYKAEDTFFSALRKELEAQGADEPTSDKIVSILEVKS